MIDNEAIPEIPVLLEKAYKVTQDVKPIANHRYLSDEDVKDLNEAATLDLGNCTTQKLMDAATKRAKSKVEEIDGWAFDRNHARYLYLLDLISAFQCEVYLAWPEDDVAYGTSFDPDKAWVDKTVHELDVDIIASRDGRIGDAGCDGIFAAKNAVKDQTFPSELDAQVQFLMAFNTAFIDSIATAPEDTRTRKGFMIGERHLQQLSRTVTAEYFHVDHSTSAYRQMLAAAKEFSGQKLTGQYFESMTDAQRFYIGYVNESMHQQMSDAF